MEKFAKLDEIVKVVKAQEAAGIAKAKDILEDVKAVEMPDFSDIGDLFKKEEPKEEKCCCCKKWVWIAAIVAGVIVIAAVIYGLYCYFTPDYLEDFEDDFEDDDFEDDFFEDEEKK